MKFKELSNEELVFLSLLIKDAVMAYDDVLEAGGIEHIVDSPLGKVHIFKELTDEERTQLEASERLRIFRSITSKLSPIVELILDSNPEMEVEIEDILFGSNEEAEDM